LSAADLVVETLEQVDAKSLRMLVHGGGEIP